MKHAVAVPSRGSRLRLNASLVREKDRNRARELRRFLLYGGAIALPLLAYVWQRVTFIEQSYRVEALSKQKQALVETQKQLTVERSFLMSPQRIESEARRRLGLIDPNPGDVKRVRMIDGRLGAVDATVAQEAGGASGGEERTGASGGATISAAAAAALIPPVTIRPHEGGRP